MINMRKYKWFIKHIAKSNIDDANDRIITLVFKVIARSFTKQSKCFWYKLVDRNQSLIRFEPFAKQYAANNKNGVVGNTGKIMPIAPSPVAKIPIIRYIIFI